MKKQLELFTIPLLFFLLTLLYLFPLLQGLVILPADLLVSNYSPWSQPGEILLKNPYMQDSVIQLYPWKHLTYQSLTQGIIPLWNPYQFLGQPFMANLKSMVFYPLNIFFIFGEIEAWNYLLFSQIFLAMLFSYYMARSFALKMLPSIVVALAFSLNSYMIGLLEAGSDAHTIIWWPLIILSVKRFLDNQQGKYLFLLGISLAFSIFASQIQYLAYFMFLLVAFIIFYGKQIASKLSHYMHLSISILLGFGIGAVQLLSSVELFSHSHRGLLSLAQKHESFTSGLMPPELIFRLLSPDFFGNPVTRDLRIGYIETSGYFGIIPLFFAIFAILFTFKNKFVKFFSIIFVTSLLFSLQGIGELLYLLKIPIITNGSGNRIFTLVLFSGSILSGLGLSQFIEMKNQKKKYWSIFIFTALYILIIIGYAILAAKPNNFLTSFLQNIEFSSIILGFFFLISLVYLFFHSRIKQAKIWNVLFLVCIIFLTFLDLFRFGYRYLTFSNEKFIYPQMGVTQFIQDASHKTLGRTFGLTEPELGTYLNVYTIETYNPLYLTRTSNLLQSLQDKSSEEVSIDNKYFLTSSGNNLKQTLDFLGVKYLVAGKDISPSMKYFKSDNYGTGLKKIYSDDKYDVYENVNAFSRFGLYYQNVVINDDEAILETINHNKVDLRKNIIIEESLPVTLQEGKGSTKLLSSTVNGGLFEINTDKPALFYLSDTYFPGWKAKVNDTETKIYRANYNFRAVVVPEGKSLVEFIYMPINFVVGIYVSIVSLLILIVISFKKKTH